MHVTKCDICKKEIKGKTIFAGVEVFIRPHTELCEYCGKPILVFLRKNKLIKENEK